MSQIRLILMPVILLLATGAVAQGEVFIATETARAEYENGTFVRGKPEFSYRFEIDRKSGRAKLTEVTRLKNNSVVQLAVDYVVTATEDQTTLSSLLVSENRRNQTIITLVGKPGNLATEVILLGDTFFEYCKASSGRLYLATGTARKAVELEEDTARELKEGLGIEEPGEP